MLALRDKREIRIDPDLKGIDELALRWASSTCEIRTPMHPLERIRLMHDGAVLGGSTAPMSDDVLAFDQTFAVAPVRERAVLVIWYRQGGSAAQKAHRLSISRASLYLYWKAALAYMRGGLRTKGFDF